MTQQYENDNVERAREIAEEELNSLITNAKSQKQTSATTDNLKSDIDVRMVEESKSDDGLGFLQDDPFEPASKRNMVSTFFEKKVYLYA